MIKGISRHAGAAKAIRAELKKHGIKASVRAKCYSGGSSVDVCIEADVLPATREAIETFCKRFQYGHFDGMTDCYNYSNVNDDLPQVTFVFVNVDYSEKIRTEAKGYVASISGINEYQQDHYAHMALNSSWGDFWLGRKPKVAATARSTA